MTHIQPQIHLVKKLWSPSCGFILCMSSVHTCPQDLICLSATQEHSTNEPLHILALVSTPSLMLNSPSIIMSYPWVLSWHFWINKQASACPSSSCPFFQDPKRLSTQSKLVAFRVSLVSDDPNILSIISVMLLVWMILWDNVGAKISYKIFF